MTAIGAWSESTLSSLIAGRRTRSRSTVETSATSSLLRRRRWRATEATRISATFVQLLRQMLEDDFRAAIERLTGRRVIAFLGASHLAPDVAAEIFVLDEPV